MPVYHHKKHDLNEDKDHKKQHLILNYEDSTLGWQDPVESNWNVTWNFGEKPNLTVGNEMVSFAHATQGDILTWGYKNSTRKVSEFNSDIEMSDGQKIFLTSIGNLTTPTDPVLYCDNSTNNVYLSTGNDLDAAEMHFVVGETGYIYMESLGATTNNLLVSMEEGRFEWNDGSDNGCFFTSDGQCSFLGQYARFDLASVGTPTTQRSQWFANISTAGQSVWEIDNAGTSPCIKVNKAIQMADDQHLYLSTGGDSYIRFNSSGWIEIECPDELDINGQVYVTEGVGLQNGKFVSWLGGGTYDKTLTWNNTAGQFEFNDNVYTSGSFIGDGSQLTNVTPDMQDNEWFYMNTADTVGIRYNSTTGEIEANNDWRFLGPAYMQEDQEFIWDIDGAGNAYTIFDSIGYLYIATEEEDTQTYIYGEGGTGIPGVYIESGTELELYGTHVKLDGCPFVLDTNEEIWFNGNSSSGTYIKHDGTDLIISNQTKIDGTLYVQNNEIHIDGDNAINFNTDGTAKTLLYDATTDNRFEFSDAVYIPTLYTDNTSIKFYGTGTYDRTLIYDGTTNNRFEFNDKLKVPNARIGSDTNYTEFDTDGHLTMTGNARVYDTVDFYPYNIGGIAGTYNGITCGASGLGTLNGFYFKTYDSGAGAGTAEASNITLMLPGSYVDGTDIQVIFDMIVGSTATTVVRWQCGLANVGDTDNFGSATYTWATPQNITCPGVTWEAERVTFTLSGTGLTKGDEVTIVLFRDADNAADTYTGDAAHSVLKVRYITDRIGQKV